MVTNYYFSRAGPHIQTDLIKTLQPFACFHWKWTQTWLENTKIKVRQDQNPWCSVGLAVPKAHTIVCHAVHAQSSVDALGLPNGWPSLACWVSRCRPTKPAGNVGSGRDILYRSLRRVTGESKQGLTSPECLNTPHWTAMFNLVHRDFTASFPALLLNAIWPLCNLFSAVQLYNQHGTSGFC